MRSFDPVKPSSFRQNHLLRNKSEPKPEAGEAPDAAESRGGRVKFESMKKRIARTLGLSGSFESKPFKLSLSNSAWKSFFSRNKLKSGKLGCYDSKRIIEMAKSRYNGGADKEPPQAPTGGGASGKKREFVSKVKELKRQRQVKKRKEEASKALGILLENLNKNLVSLMKVSLKRKNQIHSRGSLKKPKQRLFGSFQKVRSLNKSVRFLLDQVRVKADPLKSKLLRQFKRNERSLQSLNPRRKFERRGSVRNMLALDVQNNLACRSNLKLDLRDLKLGVDLSKKKAMMRRQQKNYLQGGAHQRSSGARGCSRRRSRGTSTFRIL